MSEVYKSIKSNIKSSHNSHKDDSSSKYGKKKNMMDSIRKRAILKRMGKK